MANYEWKPGSRVTSFDPTEVHGFIEAIRRKGPLTTVSVREALRAKNAPAHDYVVWDKDEAAERYQNIQVAGLLGDLRTSTGARVYVVGERRTFAQGSSIWEPFSEARHRQSFRQQQIASFHRDLERLMEKYGYLTELQGQLKLLGTIRPATRKATG